MRYIPKRGDWVRDTGRDWVGWVVGWEGAYVHVRAVGGGLEWGAEPEGLVPVDKDEALSAGVAALNARSRGESR